MESNRRTTVARPSFSVSVAFLFCLGACSPKSSTVARKDSLNSDSSFAAVQQHGAMVMGVDQYTSRHRFEPLADGGRIVLQRDTADSAGEATIRAHMKTIAAAFSRGDFTSPEFVHSTAAVPGTAVMKKLRAEITYSASDLPRGAEVRIVTRNPEAVKAIHDFLAFQRMDHRAGM